MRRTSLQTSLAAGIRRLADQAKRLSHQSPDGRFDAGEYPPEMNELCGALNTLLLSLDRGSKLQADHAQSVAHDFRNPLNNLRCQTEVLLLRPRTVAEYERLLTTNLEDYDLLGRMIDNELLLGQLDHAGITPQYANLDLQKQLQQVARQCEHLARAGNSSVSIRASGCVRADPVLFQRAIGNLLVNALHHAPPGALVDVAATPTQNATVITVSNPGPEIAAKHLEKIFDRFYRIETTRNRSAGSTGLGLAIVRSIMALHRGNVSVESRAGVTRFTLFFPRPKARFARKNINSLRLTPAPGGSTAHSVSRC